MLLGKSGALFDPCPSVSPSTHTHTHTHTSDICQNLNVKTLVILDTVQNPELYSIKPTPKRIISFLNFQRHQFYPHKRRRQEMTNATSPQHDKFQGFFFFFLKPTINNTGKNQERNAYIQVNIWMILRPTLIRFLVLMQNQMILTSQFSG